VPDAALRIRVVASSPDCRSRSINVKAILWNECGVGVNQLLAIKCFARVVQTASFTRAAESLGLPKATVSKLVSELERYLGARLLQRTTRQVSVTADGAAYYEGTAKLIRELEDFDQGFSGAHIAPRGKIRVDVGGTPGRAILVPALPDFFERYPDVQIDLGIGDRSVDLADANVDCVIRGGTLTQQSVASRLLGSASWTTCATPEYLKKHGIPTHPDDLKSGHRIVAHHLATTGRPMPIKFERGGERLEFDGPYSLSVNDGGTRAIAGLGGIGILQTFTYAIKANVERGELVPILEDWRPPRYPFHVAYPPNRKLSNRVRVFIDWLVPVFANLE
jgi:DNA-binding transcriptional LysR family regulator